MRPDSTDRSPTYGASTLVLSRLNWTTGTPELDDLVEPVGHRLAGHRDGQPVGARRHDVLGRGQLGVGVATGRPGDLDGDAEVFGGELRRIDDLLDERVADDVGDEADRQVVVGSRAGRGRRVVGWHRRPRCCAADPHRCRGGERGEYCDMSSGGGHHVLRVLLSRCLGTAGRPADAVRSPPGIAR